MSNIQRVKSTIIVTHRVTGFHFWPDAPEARGYLSHRHRHQFLIIVGHAVAHDDRAIEFHDLQDAVRGLFSKEVMDFGAKSCEMIAKDIAGGLRLLNYRPAWVECWEDEENGARIEFEDVR